MPKINKDNIFYNAGVISAIWIYEIFVVISIIFTNYFKGHVGTFILLQLVINALFFIALILITRASVHIHDINEKAYEKKQNGLYDKPKRGGF